MKPTLSPSIAALFRANPICIVDVGARGGLQSHWQQIRDYCTFVGFEPEELEAARLTRDAAANETYIARALYSDRTTVTLYHCAAPAMSSVYAPNAQVSLDIYGTVEPLAVDRTERIDVTTLDWLIQEGALPNPDFIKLDTQGSELDILKGASTALQAGVVGIETEVEFVALYRDQPLFADVDRFVRDAGYEFVGFRGLCTKFDMRFGHRGKRGYKNAVEFLLAWGARLVPPHGSLASVSQLIYGDAFYVRRMDHYLRHAQSLDAAGATTAIAKAVVLTTEFRHFEYALGLLGAASALALISDADRVELERFVRVRSRDLRPLWKAMQEQSLRLLRRLGNPARR